MQVPQVPNLLLPLNMVSMRPMYTTEALGFEPKLMCNQGCSHLRTVRTQTLVNEEARLAFTKKLA